MSFKALNNNKVYVAPSLLAADFSYLEQEIKCLSKLGVKILHLDIMDGHFVPNLSFGSSVIESLKKFNKQLIFDAHLMVTTPCDYIQLFKNAGCHHITFHLESNPNEIVKTIDAIRQVDLSVGISIRPKTSVEEVLPYLHLVDLVLVMTVEPGFGGQKFIDFSNKIHSLRENIVKKNLATHIQVDGGINSKTSRITRNAGANILVVGTNFFRHPKGQEIAFQELLD